VQKSANARTFGVKIAGGEKFFRISFPNRANFPISFLLVQAKNRSVRFFRHEKKFSQESEV